MSDTHQETGCFQLPAQAVSDLGIVTILFLLRAHAETRKKLQREVDPERPTPALDLVICNSYRYRIVKEPLPHRPRPSEARASMSVFLELEAAPRKEVRRFSPNWPGVDARSRSAATRTQASSRCSPATRP